MIFRGGGGGWGGGGGGNVALPNAIALKERLSVKQRGMTARAGFDALPDIKETEARWAYVHSMSYQGRSSLRGL